MAITDAAPMSGPGKKVKEYVSTGEQRHKELEIRSMERGICPIAVFYFALKRSFFNI